eukprot:symbB.v1.2.032696.t1/scaffold3960.1/size47443/2
MMDDGEMADFITPKLPYPNLRRPQFQPDPKYIYAMHSDSGQPLHMMSGAVESGSEHDLDLDTSHPQYDNGCDSDSDSDDMAMGIDGSSGNMMLDGDVDEGCNDDLITHPVMDGDVDVGGNDDLITQPVMDGDEDGNDELITHPVMDGYVDEGGNDDLITQPVMDGDEGGNDDLITQSVVDGDGNDDFITQPVMDEDGDEGGNADPITNPVMDGDPSNNLENLITHPLLKPSIHKGWRVPDQPFGQHHLDKYKHFGFDRFREIVRLDMEYRIYKLKRKREQCGL